MVNAAQLSERRKTTTNFWWQSDQRDRCVGLYRRRQRRQWSECDGQFGRLAWRRWRRRIGVGKFRGWRRVTAHLPAVGLPRPRAGQRQCRYRCPRGLITRTKDEAHFSRRRTPREPDGFRRARRPRRFPLWKRCRHCRSRLRLQLRQIARAQPWQNRLTGGFWCWQRL